MSHHEALLAHDEGLRVLGLGDPRAALAPLRLALALAPGLGPAHYHAALALRLLGDLPAAIHHMRLAASLLPGAPHPQTQLGALLHLAGDLTAALACYRAAAALDPSHAVSRYHLALGLVAHGLAPEGKAQLRQAIDLGLPLLLDQRARGQLADAAAPGPLAPPSLCSAPMATELLAPLLAPAPAPAPAAAPGGERGGGVVALTGAGLSAESGLRTRKELWRQHSRDDAVAIWKFQENPAVLWGVIRDFLGEGGHRPNEAHRALARLSGLAGVITQNVDGLHQQAHRDEHGQEAPYPILELHGSLDRTLCHGCGHRDGGPCSGYVRGPLPPRCPRCGGAIRPDVVLFGERVDPALAGAALRLVAGCSLLLVVGCAMDVAPASELPRLARACGARVVEFKRSPSRLARSLDTTLVPGPASGTLPAFLERLPGGSPPGRPDSGPG